MNRDDHICPECKAGKHRNCDGRAWCYQTDSGSPCRCDIAEHIEALIDEIGFVP